MNISLKESGLSLMLISVPPILDNIYNTPKPLLGSRAIFTGFFFVLNDTTILIAPILTTSK